LKRLKEIGDWMKTNSEAIYKTRPIAPYKEAKVGFTSLSDGTVYAIYLADEDENNPPATIQLYSQTPGPGTKIQMLGVPGGLKWEKAGKGMLIHVPDAIVKNPPCKHAWIFKIFKETGK